MHLAQLNIAKAKYPLDAPEIKDFVDNLEPINALAEQSDGFIWRLKDDSGNATSIEAFDSPDTVVNMSVWRSAEDLKKFMFKTHHKDFLARKREWFEDLKTDSYVLWWIGEGHIPTLQEGESKLNHLRAHGPTANAFSFKRVFDENEFMAESS